MNKIELFWLTEKYRPNKKQDKATISNKKEGINNLHIEAIKAAIYLKVKNREGRNKLIDNYIKRVESLIGAQEC